MYTKHLLTDYKRLFCVTLSASASTVFTEHLQLSYLCATESVLQQEIFMRGLLDCPFSPFRVVINIYKHRNSGYQLVCLQGCLKEPAPEWLKFVSVQIRYRISSVLCCGYRWEFSHLSISQNIVSSLCIISSLHGQVGKVLNHKGNEKVDRGYVYTGIASYPTVPLL